MPRAEHSLHFKSNKTCRKCGGKYEIEGRIKSITRNKTCPDCKRKLRKKNTGNKKKEVM
jgi:hypothetical protein